MSAGKRHGIALFSALALIGVSMLLLNLYTPLMMDDYDYSFSWSTGSRVAGVGDILASQAQHYLLWGGRSVVHFLAQLFLFLGKPAFNAANSAMYLLLLVEICALAGKRGKGLDWRMLMLAHAILLLSVPFFGVVFLWLDGACNYLWGTALALLPLLIAKSEREEGFFAMDSARGLLAVPVCFIAGWTNENTACGVLAAMMLLLLWDGLRGRKIRFWRVPALAAQALGAAVMLLAPGNFARPSEPSGRGLVMELLYRFAVVSYCLLRYAAVPAVLALVLLAVALRKKKAIRCEWLAVLGVSAFLSAYALCGSPQISDRTFTGVIALAISAMLAVFADMDLALTRRGVASFALLGVLLAGVTAGAVSGVRAHGNAWREQEARILEAAARGDAQVIISGVEAQSRFAMDIVVDKEPAAWPNSTLGKYYGIEIAGNP